MGGSHDAAHAEVGEKKFCWRAEQRRKRTMKYGYSCKCGWNLKRGKLTRIIYALKKLGHALGKSFDKELDHDGCKFIYDELKRSGAPGLQE